MRFCLPVQSHLYAKGSSLLADKPLPSTLAPVSHTFSIPPELSRSKNKNTKESRSALHRSMHLVNHSDHADLRAEHRRWPSFVGIDESVNRLFLWNAESQMIAWSQPLKTKSRSLQRLGPDRLLLASDYGYTEFSLSTGELLAEVTLPEGRIVSVLRRGDGDLLVGCMPADNHSGISFTVYDSSFRPSRIVRFPEIEYLRCSEITPTGTLLFTADVTAFEADWTGKVIREFRSTRFRHAWKPARLSNGHTLVSGGYGNCIVEFDTDGNAVNEWKASENETDLIRPFFFSDFHARADGSLVVCNWLGHDPVFGKPGYSLLEFSSSGELLSAWRAAEQISSLQTFLLI